MRTLFSVFSLSALTLGAVLSSTSQDQTTGKPTTLGLSKAAMKKTHADMQGAWRLVELKARTYREDRRDQVGFCLVSGNYLAIEVHLWWMGNTGTPDHRDFISGMHRFELDQDSNIETYTVIASFINDLGRVDHEEPGKSRRYQIEVQGDVMRMVRADEQTMVFERLSHGEEERDIFGRPVPKKAESDERKQ